MTKEELLDQLLTRREAEKYADLTSSAMQYHLKAKNIVPCKESGKGNAKIQLFWKDDMDKLIKEIMK